MKKLQRRLSFANVVSMIALFVALGGSAYAVTRLPKNSVGSKQLKTNAVTGAKIKNDAVSRAKIDFSTLGAVPSATNAETAGNARALDGKSAQEITAQSKLACPAGTVLQDSLCFEPSARPGTSLTAAMIQCAESGRWLPNISQLLAYERKSYSSAPPSEWTESISASGSGVYGYLLSASTSQTSYEVIEASTAQPFRCVTGATN